MLVPWGLPKILRGIEKPIYEYTGSDKPFYYYKDKTDYPDEKVPNSETSSDNRYLFDWIMSMKMEIRSKILGQDGDRFEDQLYFSRTTTPALTVSGKSKSLHNVENIT